MIPEIYLWSQLWVVFDCEPLVYKRRFPAHCAVGHDRLGEFTNKTKICFFTVGVTNLCWDTLTSS